MAGFYIVLYESKKYHLSELVPNLLSEGRFHDVVIDGEVSNQGMLSDLRRS